MKTRAGMATIKRREAALEESVSSLAGQCDELVVYLNDYTTLSPWMSSCPSSVTFLRGGEALGDLGDAAKFYASGDPNCIFLPVDDDIVYPEDYVARMRARLSDYHGAVIVTHHGRIVTGPLPIERYYAFDNQVHLFRSAPADVAVNFGGSGCMAFDGSIVGFSIADCGPERNMADIWVGIYAQRRRIPIVALAHSEGWLRPSDRVPIEDSIYYRLAKFDYPAAVINRELRDVGLKLYAPGG